MKEIFNIYGMTCSACQSHIQNAVEKVNGVTTVNVNLLQNNMTVEYDEKLCSTETICECVKNAGYKATSNKNSEQQPTNTHSSTPLKKQLVSLILSFIFLIVLMYFAMGNKMWGFKTLKIFDYKENPIGFSLIQFIILIPIIIINRNYFVNGFKRLFKGSPNMDSLIAIGSSVSILYGIIGLFIMSFSQAQISSLININPSTVLDKFDYYSNLLKKYSNNLYWESAGMILTLVSLGKFFEKISTSKTTNAISKLLDLSPKTAIILTPENIEQEVLVENVHVNDIIVIKKGALVPVDGIIIEGKASINESNITGESIPVLKQNNDEVFSSTVVESGYIKIKATKIGENTTFANIVKLVEEASNSKAPISKLADKISGIFVPLIFTIAIITFIVNLFVHNSFELALNFAITTIVIACPCALGLATPVAIMVGTGKGAENGLLIRNAEIMEKAHNIKTIVLDKTGTITEGSPKVISFEFLDKITETEKQEIVSVIYSIENKSEHPLAQAITTHFLDFNKDNIDIDNFSSIDGLGLTGKYKDSTYFIGNINYLLQNNINFDNIKQKINESSLNAEIPLIVLKNRKIIAIFAIKDKIKENSAEAISILKKMGLNVIMLTGDNKTTSNIIANNIGIDSVISEVKPKDKQEIILNLKQQFSDKKNHLVAMVGDGVNDAPALKSADIGISIGSGSDIAIETSDIVLLKNNLFDVANVIKLSNRIFSTIKLGLFWAFFYNFICVIIASGVFYIPFNLMINPMIGSIAMSFSSVSVVLNALTINLFKPLKPLNIMKDPSKTFNDNNDNSDFILNESQENIDNNKEEETMSNQNLEFYVKGMMCHNCENHIRKALEESGAENILIDLTSKKIQISTTLSKDEIYSILKTAGYDATDN